MAQILLEAKGHSETSAAAGRRKVPAAKAPRIRTRYGHTLDVALHLLPVGSPPDRGRPGEWTNAQREAWNLATRMRRHQNQLLRMLDDTRVPMDNNSAERALRMVKIHDKVSGSFRSLTSAEAFATIRSYVQTAGQHELNRLDLLRQLFTLEEVHGGCPDERASTLSGL